MQTLLETGLSNALIAALLAVVAFACSRWGRPALAHGLWLLVLVKLLTPALVPISLPWPAVAEPATTEPPSPLRDELLARLAAEESGPDDPVILGAFAVQATSEESLTETALPVGTAELEPQSALPGWRECLAALWLGGLLLWFAWTLCSVWRFQRLLRAARPAPAALQAEARSLAARLGLHHCPRVVLVPGVVSPMIWAIGAGSRLLFPSRLLGLLDAEQRAALLLHELAHVRRRDHWVRLVEWLALGLYWWHPLVWLARHQLRAAEEECCDAWVVWASSGAGHAYATALLQTVAFVSRASIPLPVGASGMGQVSHLRRRLNMIMRGNTPASLSATGWLALVGLAAFLLPLAAQAQQPRDDGRDQEIRALKEKLRKFEQESRAQKGKSDTKSAEQSAPEVQELVRAAQELKQEIGKRRAELQAMEAKMEAIQARLAEFKPGEFKKFSKDNLDGQKLDKEKLLLEREYKSAVEQQRRQAEEAVKRAKQEMDTQQRQFKREAELFQRNLAGAAEAEAKQKLKLDMKGTSLEQRLERIMKEVELLRQDIHEAKGKQQAK